MTNQALSGTIVAALIAFTSTIIVCVLGILSNRKNTATHKQRHELYQYLLTNVYQPLHVAYLNNGLSKEFVSKLGSVHEAHAAYVPPQIETRIISLQKDIKKKEIDYHDVRLNEIIKYIDSDYNEIRRYLGLAYAKKRIDNTYLSYGETRHLFQGFFRLLALCYSLLLLIFVIFFGIGFTMNWITRPAEHETSMFFYIGTLVVLVMALVGTVTKNLIARLSNR